GTAPAGAADKLARARALGMDAGVVVEAGKFADAVRAAGGEASVVVELVGGPYVAEDLRCLQPLGRIVLVGLLAGAKCELDLALVLRKRLRIFGTVLRA